MDNELTLGYSPCPNDTFVFYALAHNLIDCNGISFKIELLDVETLNRKAIDGVFDVSKLSFAAIGHLLDKYRLLRSGSALGRGCGPLVVARPGFGLNQISSQKIAVPGILTTASMLLSLYLPAKPALVSMPFDRIMPAVQNGDFDFGVIIHEGRFTFKEYGLVSLVDLGQWWEKKTALPIPLGGIAILRNKTPEQVKKVESIIRQSVKYAFENRAETFNYVKKHARETKAAVIKQHIDLYVNDFTIDIKQEGKEAIDRLFAMASDKKLLSFKNIPLSKE